MIHQTVEKLYEMRLKVMGNAFSELSNSRTKSDLSFEEKVAMIVDEEWNERASRRLSRRLKEARLGNEARIEDIDFRHPRGLDRSVTLSLVGCDWIRNGENVIITGPAGIGKSFLAKALTEKACREGFASLYWRAPALFREFARARADGSYPNLLDKLTRVQLLVIDDWGLAPLGDHERRDLLEIVDERHGRRATMMTSQYPIAKWHDLIGEPTIADAILDRLVHAAHRIALKGDSLRKSHAKKGGNI